MPPKLSSSSIRTSIRAPAPRADELPVQVLRQFRMVFSSVRGHFRELEKRTGLGGAQVWALSHIRENPGGGVNQLAAALDIHQSTASNLVRSLVTKGLVRTEQGQEDRRSVRLLICPAGRVVLRKVPAPFTGILPKALASLDAATLKRLRRDLQALIEIMAPDESAARKLISQM